MDSYELQDKRLRRIDETLDKKYEKLEKKWHALQERRGKVQTRLNLARQRAAKNGGADEALMKRSKALRARENQLEKEYIKLNEVTTSNTGVKSAIDSLRLELVQKKSALSKITRELEQGR